ncbi:Stress response protein NhaX [Novipirellula aureliae]|uniref:Stress response protein NhaX n=1 Tax=Novipirellula aureliae TaxID=2527966 RepID=A0A5C6DYE2_9BACT|nr:universal stress protein [Novipirellula aureliae]TWU40066.1 Stress response protein NhaX [Novipirellula aureliae]
MKKNLILCPVDFSASTELAITLAVDLAKAGNSKIILLHVIDTNNPPISINVSIDMRLQTRLRKQYLDYHEVDWKFVRKRGDPAETTIAYAKENTVDLIIMGTQGRTELANLVVGSIARRVMAGANCPVVTVKTPVNSGALSLQGSPMPLRAI